jgi:hypothetical protein
VSAMRGTREALGEVAEREVVGTEVVTPLADAVRLVDRDHAERPRCSSAVVAGALSRSGAT